MVEEKPNRFVKLFRVALRKPDTYDARRISMRIKDIFDSLDRQ